MDDISNYGRKLKLTAHFKNNKPIDLTDVSVRFRPLPDKKWTPPKVHHTINTFVESFENQLKRENLHQNRDKKKNLNKEELKALQNLQKRDDIIIINADKGGAITIMDTDDYVKEGNRQLNDELCYKKLEHNPTVNHVNTVHDTIDLFKNQQKITERVAEGLKVNNAKTPTLKLPPKVHKQGHPGRPLVSSIHSPTSKISEYVDFHLQPYTKTIKSHLKDTKHFLTELDKVTASTSKDSYLVTLDVRSLYTNIPNEEGINVITNLLRRSQSKVTTVITAFLWLILTLNNFIFNGNNYLQILGVAMGTKCAVIYANLFMSHFEETHIYELIRGFCPFYKRFIDDIFLLWNGSLDELNKIIEDLNTLHPTIKFNAKYSQPQSNFLIPPSTNHQMVNCIRPSIQNRLIDNPIYTTNRITRFHVNAV